MIAHNKMEDTLQNIQICIHREHAEQCVTSCHMIYATNDHLNKNLGGTDTCITPC